MSNGGEVPSRKAVFAVVVTFQPPASLLDNLQQLEPQVGEVVVVDNGSPASSARLLEETEKSGIRLIRNEKNLGIAAALNIGIKEAISKGYRWVATFDQDSTVTPGFFETMFSAYETCPFHERVALLSPTLCVSAEECQGKSGEPLPLYTKSPTAMTSGSLFKTEIFAREGFYDEGFFMDYVDYDFCLRVRKHGWKILRANRACLVHRLGAAETHSFLGFKVTIKSHTPWRRYHIMRNRITIYRRHAFSSPLWCFYDFVWIFLELLKVLLFEKEKGAKFRNVVRGFVDGMLGRTGPLQESHKS